MGASVDDLAAVEGIGPVIARSCTSGIAERTTRTSSLAWSQPANAEARPGALGSCPRR